MPGIRSPLKSILLVMIVSSLSLTAGAQKVEIFGGYQFTHLQTAFNANGWNASLTGNFKHVLGITADFSGAYKNNISVYTYTFGPVLTARLPVVQPFAHALWGNDILRWRFNDRGCHAARWRPRRGVAQRNRMESDTSRLGRYAF